MTMYIRNEYFNWLCNLVRPASGSYELLLGYLDRINFNYSIPMDGNREEDGINLRYRFGKECGYDDVTICSCLDNRPCSILEMMVALSLRCENIMEDLDIGMQVSRWFEIMLENLHLIWANDTRFIPEKVKECIDKFENRTYSRNGDGGLFKVDDPTVDMRILEIWSQMCVYLNEKFSYQ